MQTRLFVRQSAQANNRENLKIHINNLCEWNHADRWIPLTNGQSCGKRFHVMISSCQPCSLTHKELGYIFLNVILFSCVVHYQYLYFWMTVQWRHNWCDSVSNHQPHDCLLNRLFRRRSMKTSELRATGLCVGNFSVDRWISRTNGQ